MKIEELEEKVAHIRKLRWMEGEANEYRDMLALINQNLDYFTICSVGYSCRGSERVMVINPHHPIPAKYLRDGLAEAIGNLDREIETLKAEIER